MCLPWQGGFEKLHIGRVKNVLSDFIYVVFDKVDAHFSIEIVVRFCWFAVVCSIVFFYNHHCFSDPSEQLIWGFPRFYCQNGEACNDEQLVIQQNCTLFPEQGCPCELFRTSGYNFAIVGNANSHSLVCPLNEFTKLL
jgi:hypothetical protein